MALPCCWVTAHLYQQQTSIGVFAVAQACCQLVLHSSTEQGAIVQEQCGTALLLGHCTPIPTANLPKRICNVPSLLCSTEQGAIAKSSVALHCWVTAHLYQQQMCICSFCTAALSSRQLPKAVWHCTAVGSLHTYTNSKPP